MAHTIMDWKEYIAHQTSHEIFTQNSPFPENDPRVLQEFLNLVEHETGTKEKAEIVVLAERYGFYLDEIDTGREGANVARSTSLIDVNLGVSYGDFIKDLPRIKDEAGEYVILTDTFSFSDGYGAGGESHDGLMWLHSPVADITASFDAYLETLTTERRKKFRRSLADFEKTPLRFEMSEDGLTPADLDFIRVNLEKKWGEDAPYAFRQTLWAHSVSKHRPKQMLVMRVMDGNNMVFIQTMIVKGRAVYCQSIAKDEDHFFNGLASFTDFQCIKSLCGDKGYEIFDPSCRCSLDDPESIGIAKRATVNKNCPKPLLSIGIMPEEIAEMLKAGNLHGKEA